jgi:hypothetical protein
MHIMSSTPSTSKLRCSLCPQHGGHLSCCRGFLTLLPPRLCGIKDVLLNPTVFGKSSVGMLLIDVIWRCRWLRPTLVRLLICRVGRCAHSLLWCLTDFPDASSSAGVCKITKLGNGICMGLVKKRDFAYGSYRCCEHHSPICHLSWTSPLCI